jgi:hypothetical protein
MRQLFDSVLLGHSNSQVQSHAHHVTLYYLLLNFHYNMLTRAVVNKNLGLLLESFDSVWTLFYALLMGTNASGATNVRLSTAMQALSYCCEQCYRTGSCIQLCTTTECRAQTGHKGPVAPIVGNTGFMKAFNTDYLSWSSLGSVESAAVVSSDPVCNLLIKEDDYFQNNTQIKSLLRRLVDSRCFKINKIKQGISRYFTSYGLNLHPSPLFRPHALNVEYMFDPLLFQSGSILLDPASYSLQPTIMAHFHVACCSTCHEFHEVQPTCYFFSKLRCISHGWHDYTSIVPFYKVTGNYPAVALYSTHVDTELDKMCASQVLHPIQGSSARFLTPINAVIKNSDRNRARTILSTLTCTVHCTHYIYFTLYSLYMFPIFLFPMLRVSSSTSVHSHMF